MELFTIKDLAQALGVGESTVRFWRDRYEDFFPFVGEGKRRRYRAEALDVLRFIAERANRSENAEQIAEALGLAFPRFVGIAVESQRSNAATQQRESQSLPVIPSEFVERFLVAFENQARALAKLAAVQERRAEIVESRLAALEAARTPQDQRKPLPATRRPSEAPTARTSRADALNLVLELHREGLGTKRIARRLNEDGTPTLSGKGRWAKGIVQKLLAEAGL